MLLGDASLLLLVLHHHFSAFFCALCSPQLSDMDANDVPCRRPGEESENMTAKHFLIVMHMMGAKKTILQRENERKKKLPWQRPRLMAKWVQRSERNWNWRDSVPLKMSSPIIEVKSKARDSQATPRWFLDFPSKLSDNRAAFPSPPENGSARRTEKGLRKVDEAARIPPPSRWRCVSLLRQKFNARLRNKTFLFLSTDACRKIIPDGDDCVSHKDGAPEGSTSFSKAVERLFLAAISLETDQDCGETWHGEVIADQVKRLLSRKI